jgi:hypothetical protein
LVCSKTVWSKTRNTLKRVERLASPRFPQQRADELSQTVEPAETLVHFDEKRELARKLFPARHNLAEED